MVSCGFASTSVHESVSFGRSHPWTVTAWPGVSGILIAALDISRSPVAF